MKIKILETYGVIRIPKNKTVQKTKSIREEPQKHIYKIKIKPQRFLVKNIDAKIFRFKIKERKLFFKRTDIPNIVYNKFKEHHTCSYIEEFVRKSIKASDFFDWTPQSIRKIGEMV